ncbi:hypothetical protein D3C76_1285250 [compost metagenome]
MVVAGGQQDGEAIIQRIGQGFGGHRNGHRGTKLDLDRQSLTPCIGGQLHQIETENTKIVERLPLAPGPVTNGLKAGSSC